MGFLDNTRRFFGMEKRSSLENPQTPLSFPAEWLLDIFNGGRTDSGIRVSEMTALQVSTVLACVNIISNGIAGLPLNVYERTVKNNRLGKTLSFDHGLFDLLHNEPNEEMTSFSWRKVLQVHALLWGNGYCEIERNNANEVIGLWPRNPARTRPVRITAPMTIEGTRYPTGTMVYETTETVGDSQMGHEDSLDNKTGLKRLVLCEDMLHIPGLSLDGRMGQSTVWLARQTIGLALATEKYGAKFFGNSARPAGVLELPGTLEPKAIENLRRSWAEAHGGENGWKTAVLESGVKFQKIAATPEEGQYLQTRNYVRTEIATIYNVPPHMVGETEKSKSNVEQSSIEFVLYCLGPWITSWEQELRRKLMPKMGRSSGKYFAKFDVRRLLYPDAASRSKFYATGRQWGFLNGNDIRELEDMDPIAGPAGAAYWMPVNMMDAGDINQIVPAGAPNPNEPEPTVPAKTKPGMPDKAPIKKVVPSKKKVRSTTFGSGGGTELPSLPEYIMRHGITDFNDSDTYRGWSDIDLNEEGRALIARVGEFLKDKGIKRIVSCDLVRCKTTAEIISRALGITAVTYTDKLRTWNHGYSGEKQSEVGDKVRYFIDHPDETPPNGGETLSYFISRVNEIMDQTTAENDSAGPTLVIACGSTIASWGESADEVEAALHGKEGLHPGGVAQYQDEEMTIIFNEGKAKQSHGS